MAPKYFPKLERSEQPPIFKELAKDLKTYLPDQD